VQAGTPSDAFMAAGAQWNAARFTETGTTNKHDSVDIPLTTVSSLNVAAPNMTTSGIVARLAVIDTELKALAASVDKTNKEFEQLALQTELAKRKVIVSVLVNSLQDTGAAAKPAKDEVFVQITGGAGVQKTPISSLGVGAPKDYEIVISRLLPFGKALVAQDVEHDRAGTTSAAKDDLVLDHKWASPFMPVPAVAGTLNGGNYTITLRFDK
jgi:hypothetical protein